MSLARSGYALHFEPLRSGDDAAGEAAVVPWDSEIFGFPVGVYKHGAAPADREAPLLASWLDRNRIGLCSCVVPAADRPWRAALPDLGFQFVDLALRMTLNGLRKARLAEPRIVLREAAPGDRKAIEAIAEQAFDHGRYHADPWFPRDLADRRYRHWVASALDGSEIDRIYVTGDAGRVDGFYHVTLEDGVSDLRLAAVAPHLRGTMLGFDLYLAILHTLQQLGARRVVTSISASNTAVMNVYAMLGFHFSEPEAVYHWHGPTLPARSG